MIRELITSIFEIAEYAAMNRDRAIAVMVSDSSERSYSALAFGVQIDNILPDCHQYDAQRKVIGLDSGSTISFYTPETIVRMRAMNYDTAVIDYRGLPVEPEVIQMARLRTRGTSGKGVVWLGR